MITPSIDRPVRSSAELIALPGSSVITRECRICGNSFDVPDRPLAQFVFHCPECSELNAISDGKKKLAESKIIRDGQWKEICPADFVTTDPAKLPNQKSYQAVMNWRYGQFGLFLYGKSGKGKSRCAWMLAEREFRAGKTVNSLNATSGLCYGAKFATSASDAERWVKLHIAADILLLDDVFKCKLTDSFEAMLFLTISERTERKRPVIITSNDTGNSLMQRMSADRGPALVRRLKEFCGVISFE